MAEQDSAEARVLFLSSLCEKVQPMRTYQVAVLVQGSVVPSSRFRILQYLPTLATYGIECEVYAPAFPPGGFAHRIFPWKLYHFVKHGSQLLFYLPPRFAQLRRIDRMNYDAIFVQKPLMRWPPLPILEQFLSRRGHRIIFDLDYAVYARSSMQKNYIDRVVSLCSCVIVGNKSLAAELSHAEDKIAVLPTTVDESRYMRLQKTDSDTVCLGWTGTSSNLKYLVRIAPALEQLSLNPAVRIKVISDLDHVPALSHIANIEFCRWNMKQEINQLSEFDIGLMPLTQDLWAQGKCGFKLIQYMALGIPSVCSPVGANAEIVRDGQTGYHADTEQAWVEKLEMLVRDRAARTKMGENALADFRERYSLAHNARVLAGIIQNACSLDRLSRPDAAAADQACPGTGEAPEGKPSPDHDLFFRRGGDIMRHDYSESLLVHFRRVEALRAEALECKAIHLNARQLCDLELLLNRGFYPLSGYIGQADYESVLERMRLADGTVWPIPICLDVTKAEAGRFIAGERVALNDQEGFLLAVLTVEEIWQPDKTEESLAVYGTDDPVAHPGVMHLYDRTENWYLGGRLEGVMLPIHYDFQHLRLSPSETVRAFTMNGWRRVLGFHTDEYLHCAHREMVIAAAREAGAAIFLQPVADFSYPGNLNYYTQIRCYQVFTEKFPANMIKLGLTPYAGRKAGPREALWQAIIRKNFGCSHFMVAEDHADPFADGNGEGLFYQRGAAQQLVARFAEETGIAMIPQREMGYHRVLKKYVDLGQGSGDKIEAISSRELKRRLVCGEDIPSWFCYPEVVDRLQCSFPPRAKQGFTIFMTGLSGSGKSTIAKVLLVKFMEMNDRPVTLLDGDIVRRNLSSELSFSREHRNLNITRIGFVAGEITKNGGIALCAPIAPYEESRQANRELISRCGGYIEVYVSTPLEVCEQRDRKGLYAKARAGKVKGVTGVNDPYIPPANPELIIDTSEITPMEAAQEILLYLEEQGYLA